MGEQLKFVIIGDRQSEKSFASFYLRDKFKFKKVRIADPVETFIRRVYKVPFGHKSDRHLKNRIYHALYDLDSEMFIRYLTWRLEQTTIPRIVIDDVQYLNELNKLEELGFTTIRISSGRNKKPPRNLDDRYILLYEMFGKHLNKYNVDYSIIHTSRESSKQTLSRIVEQELDK